MRHLPLVAMALLALLTSSPTNAEQTGPICVHTQTAIEPNSRYAFAEANIIGLTYALSAWQEGTEFEKERGDLAPINALVAMMRHTKSATEAYACAAQVISPYVKSQDSDMIATPARFEVAEYVQHIRLNDQFLAVLRSLSGANDPTTLADALSTLEVERGKAWTGLTQATTLVAMGLIDVTKTSPGGNLDSLLITCAERQQLLSRLLEWFPDLKDKANSATLPTPTRLASLYYTLLTKGYKCADK